MITRSVDIVIGAGVLVGGWLLLREFRNRKSSQFLTILMLYLSAVVACIWAAGLALPVHSQTLPGVRAYIGAAGFFAAVIVLPLAWVVSVIRLGIPKLRDPNVAPAAIRCAALTICTGLLVGQFGQLKMKDEFRLPERRLARLQKSLRAIADGDHELPRDHWDPEYVVGTVGRDSAALFRWVQRRTFWIPYRGVLRGPIGVLMDRRGNELDRSLLLATLLEKAGWKVRMAHGELKRDESISMLPRLVTELSFGSDNVERNESFIPEVQNTAQSYDLEASSIRRVLADQADRSKKISKELNDRVEQQTNNLLKSIPQAKRVPEWNDRLEANIASLQDHWWVQVQDGNRWADLDLFVGDGTSSVALTTQYETFSLTDLSPDLYHQVTIRVVEEQWSDGATKERSAFEYSLRPAEVIGQPIVLQIIPAGWISDSAPAMQTLSDIPSALKFDQWAAGLVVDGKNVASGVLRDSGENSAPSSGLFGLGAALDSTMSEGRHAARPSHVLTATWIEYEIRIPGKMPRVLRRTIFDLLGPTGRSAHTDHFELDEKKKLARSLALSMKTEILPMVCQLSPEFVAHLTSAPFDADKELLSAVLRPEFSPDSDELKQMFKRAVPPASALVGLAYTRFEHERAHHDIFLDEPNILSRHRYLITTSNGIAFDDAIDIVNNDVGVSLSSPDAFAIRLEQGVRDTNSEALLFGGGAIANTGEAYTESQNWVTITPNDRTNVESVRFTDDVRKLVSEEIEDGQFVVVPSAPIHRSREEYVGWWRIDPKTGTTLGIAQNGWGQAIAEEARISAVIQVGEAFLWETGLCHTFAQVLNYQIYVKELIVGDWHPSWTGPGNVSKNPVAVAKDSERMCLIQAIASGFVATLPLLMMSMRNSRLMRRLEMEEAEEFARRRVPPREPCLAVVKEPTVQPLFAAFSFSPLIAIVFSDTLPCIPPHGEGPPPTPKSMDESKPGTNPDDLPSTEKADDCPGGDGLTNRENTGDWTGWDQGPPPWRSYSPGYGPPTNPEVVDKMIRFQQNNIARLQGNVAAARQEYIDAEQQYEKAAQEVKDLRAQNGVTAKQIDDAVASKIKADNEVIDAQRNLATAEKDAELQQGWVKRLESERAVNQEAWERYQELQSAEQKFDKLLHGKNPSSQNPFNSQEWKEFQDAKKQFELAQQKLRDLDKAPGTCGYDETLPDPALKDTDPGQPISKLDPSLYGGGSQNGPPTLQSKQLPRGSPVGSEEDPIPSTQPGGQPTRDYSNNGPLTQRSPRPNQNPPTAESKTLVGMGGTLDALGGPN